MVCGVDLARSYCSRRRGFPLCRDLFACFRYLIPGNMNPFFYFLPFGLVPISRYAQFRLAPPLALLPRIACIRDSQPRTRSQSWSRRSEKSPSPNMPGMNVSRAKTTSQSGISPSLIAALPTTNGWRGRRRLLKTHDAAPRTPPRAQTAISSLSRASAAALLPYRATVAKLVLAAGKVKGESRYQATGLRQGSPLVSPMRYVSRDENPLRLLRTFVEPTPVAV